MDVEPRAKRKAELLWLLHPATGADLYFPPARPPNGFAGRLVMQDFHADAMIFDYSWSGRPRFSKLPAGASMHLHQYRLRTTPTQRHSYVLDIIHPYLFRELGNIVKQCAEESSYFPSPLPLSRIPPFQRRRSSLPYRSSEGWRPHSGIARDQLMLALHSGLQQIATQLHHELGDETPHVEDGTAGEDLGDEARQSRSRCFAEPSALKENI